MILLSNSTLSLSDAEEGMRGASVPLATVKGAVSTLISSHRSASMKLVIGKFKTSEGSVTGKRPTATHA